MNYKRELLDLLKLANRCRRLQTSLPKINSFKAIKETEAVENGLDRMLRRIETALSVDAEQAGPWELELRQLFKLANECRIIQNGYFGGRASITSSMVKDVEGRLDELLLRIAIALELQDRAAEIALLE